MAHTETDSGVGYHFDCITVDRVSVGMRWAMTNADIPYMMSNAFGNCDNPLIILLLINIVLLIVGIFMDMTPAVTNLYTNITASTQLGMEPSTHPVL